MRLHSSEELKEIDAVVRDEREFILDDAVGEFPIRLTAQTETVDVGCFETGTMSNSDQLLMQSLVDQEPHALLSRVLSGKDFRPRGFFPCQGRRLSGFLGWSAGRM